MQRNQPDPILRPARIAAVFDAADRPPPNTGVIRDRIRLQRNLTPVTDQVPAVVNVPVRHLSGAAWVNHFPTSTLTGDLTSPFRENAIAFIAALRAARATVSITATLRPWQRAYLMHWSWKIVKHNADPQRIPARAGVHIKWDHASPDGSYSRRASISAANAMINGYGIQNLRVAPALNSRHIEGNAIDMSISWARTLTIDNAAGTTVRIATTPRTGMNADLHTVGASYGVIKFSGGDRDKPHWSDNGR